MGQPITVTERPTQRRDVIRFELNRSLTGMGHERFPTSPTGPRPVDELARRLFAFGGVEGIHMFSNVVTVDLAKGVNGAGMKEVVEGLFIHYTPGVVPPTDAELEAQAPS